MNQKIINTLILTLLLILSGCKGEKTSFENNRKYIGFSAETRWTYYFKSDGKYVLESEGHGGGNPQIGSYVLKDSIILLIAEREYFEDWRFNRFKISNQECLRNYWGYFYCDTEEGLSEISEKRFWEERLLEENIENLEVVTNKRKQLVSQDSTKNLSLRNKGIIIENGNEFYEYRLESWMPKYRRNRVHLRLYAKYDPIRIFDDKFNLIKEITITAGPKRNNTIQ